MTHEGLVNFMTGCELTTVDADGVGKLANSQ